MKKNTTVNIVTNTLSTSQIINVHTNIPPTQYCENSSPSLRCFKHSKSLCRDRETSHSATGLSDLLTSNVFTNRQSQQPLTLAILVIAMLFATSSTYKHHIPPLPNSVTSRDGTNSVDYSSVKIVHKNATALNTPRIVTIGQHGILTGTLPVNADEITTPAFQRRLKELKAVMQRENGAGIAAPQIGWNASVFVVGVDPTHPAYNKTAPTGSFAITGNDAPIAFWINPEIIDQSREAVYAWEGCMSVPGVRGWVQRPANITMQGYDARGEWKQAHFHGLLSRLVQHEASHLDGSLFVDMVNHPRFLVPKPAFLYQDDWVDNWPSPGSRRTPIGMISTEE